MTWTYNESPFRYVALLILVLPCFAVYDMNTLFLIAPATMLSMAILWHIPYRVIVVAPEHIDEALGELEPLQEDVRLIVYHKSADAYAREMSKKQ
jgi:hypothetical protein